VDILLVYDSVVIWGVDATAGESPPVWMFIIDRSSSFVYLQTVLFWQKIDYPIFCRPFSIYPPPPVYHLSMDPLNIRSNHLLLIIPHELISLTLELLDAASIFSLSLTSKKYRRHKSIQLFVFDQRFPSPECCIPNIHLDAISNGHTDLFKLLAPNKKDIDVVRYIQEAVSNGRLDILKYLHEIGNPLNRNIYGLCCYAAENGHFECLKYLHENEYSWNDATCNRAAENGDMDILKYLHENGCLWNEYACVRAAENGHFECLKYLHENGCLWNEYAVTYAAENGHVDVLKYLYENGCPFDESLRITVTKKGNMDVMKYLHEIGFGL